LKKEKRAQENRQRVQHLEARPTRSARASFHHQCFGRHALSVYGSYFYFQFSISDFRPSTFQCFLVETTT
jgi:hypothetical protein